LPDALDGPIRRRLAALGTGGDPVRSRNTGNYAFRGLWSVKLHPNGYHIDHVHPQGWLSSACYVETVKDNGREGWIKFGQPGVPTTPALEAEHFEKPEPGLLVLFPSYMWHGTVPFSGDQTRLTFAFDIVPA
jgi:Putative 2OG-Fe(II) oxygenase